MKKVLIVDDDLHNRFLLKLVLEKNSYLVLEAQSGKEGIEKAHNEDPDIILLDVMMPDTDGFEVYKQIQHLDIPVIFLTALGEKDFEDKNVDYILKPIDINLLLEKIKEKTA